MITAILKVLGLSLAASILSVLLKDRNKEASLILSLAASAIIITHFLLNSGSFIKNIKELFYVAGENNLYFSILIKALGIALLSQFVFDVCSDAGEKALARNAVTGGKLAVLFLTIPLLKRLLDELKNIFTL